MSVLVSNTLKSEGRNIPLPDAVWRASQIASYKAPVTSTGYRTLDGELPNKGWPSSALIDLLLQQNGIGEMQLLRPALTAVASKRRIALLQPPHMPQIAAWAEWGLPVDRLLWIRTERSADALWAAEQIIRNGSCGALLFWQSHVRNESLRRLHLAAQGIDILFWMMRPLACSQDASPSPLRLALRPADRGMDIEIVKRRGPRRDEPLYLQLDGLPSFPTHFSASSHAHMDWRVPAVNVSRNGAAELV